MGEEKKADLRRAQVAFRREVANSLNGGEYQERVTKTLNDVRDHCSAKSLLASSSDMEGDTSSPPRTLLASSSSMESHSFSGPVSTPLPPGAGMVATPTPSNSSSSSSTSFS